MLKLVRHKSPARWHAWRRKHVGASDSVSILGFGYSGSGALPTYMSKIGNPIPFDPTESMLLGQFCEAAICRLLGMRKKDPIMIDRLHHVCVESPEHKFIGCSPDGLVCSDESSCEECPAEIKNLTYWGAAEIDTSDPEAALPLKYQIQMQHQMYCCQTSRALFVANMANEKVYTKWEMRDEDFIQGTLLPALIEFWDRVQRRDPPPESDPVVFTTCLKHQHPIATDEVMSLPETWTDGFGTAWSLPEAIETRTKMAATAKESELAKKTVDAQIQSLMGDAQYGLLPGGRCARWSNTKRGRVFTILDTVPKGIEA